MSQKLTQPEELDRILRGLSQNDFAAIFKALPERDSPIGTMGHNMLRGGADAASAFYEANTSANAGRGLPP